MSDESFLYGILASLTKFLDSRTSMMKAMYQEDVRRDFLMKEKLQSLDETGGVTVQPVSNPTDLSPVNNLMPNIMMGSAARSDTGQRGNTVRAASGFMGPLGPNVNVSNAVDISASPVGATDLSTDLQDIGLNDGIHKNISAKIEDDFELDERLKEAFGRTLALPAKAAAVALVDLMSKIPPAGEASAQAITNNIAELTAAFDLQPMNVDKDKTDDEGADSDDPDDSKNFGLLELLVAGVTAGASALGADGDDPSTPTSGAIVTTGSGGMGDPPYLKSPPYTGTADGIGLGGASGRSLEPTKDRSILQKSFMMSPLGMSLMGGNSILNSVSQTDQFKNLVNVSKDVFNNTGLGFMANLGSNFMSGVSNIFNSEGNKVNLTELTDSVIQQNIERAQEKVNLETASLIGNDSMSSSMLPKPFKPPSVEGTDIAKPRVKQSVYLSVYNKTSQF